MWPQGLRITYQPLAEGHSTVGVIEAHDVDADAFEVADELGGFGLLPGGQLGGEFQHAGREIDLDEFALGGGHQLADIDIAGFGVGGEGGDGQHRGQAGGGNKETKVFHGELVEVGAGQVSRMPPSHSCPTQSCR